MVDQSPIGRSPRSNPVTYIKAFDEIRAVFAETVEARTRNLDAGQFSFNIDGGRCPVCHGDGYLEIDMQFLADVYMKCPECQGRRYRREILDVKYRGRNIADVLDMTVREAFTFFRGHPKVQARLKRLIDVGLDYLRLGQPANTLSGGEAQRLKLAGYMSGSQALAVAVFARRADDRPALSGHRAIARLLRRPAGRRAFADRRRAQSAIDEGGRLHHRSGPGRRRSGWPGGRARNARNGRPLAANRSPAGFSAKPCACRRRSALTGMTACPAIRPKSPASRSGCWRSALFHPGDRNRLPGLCPVDRRAGCGRARRPGSTGPSLPTPRPCGHATPSAAGRAPPTGRPKPGSPNPVFGRRPAPYVYRYEFRFPAAERAAVTGHVWHPPAGGAGRSFGIRSQALGAAGSRGRLDRPRQSRLWPRGTKRRWLRWSNIPSDELCERGQSIGSAAGGSRAGEAMSAPNCAGWLAGRPWESRFWTVAAGGDDLRRHAPKSVLGPVVSAAAAARAGRLGPTAVLRSGRAGRICPPRRRLPVADRGRAAERQLVDRRPRPAPPATACSAIWRPRECRWPVTWFSASDVTAKMRWNPTATTTDNRRPTPPRSGPLRAANALCAAGRRRAAAAGRQFGLVVSAAGRSARTWPILLVRAGVGPAADRRSRFSGAEQSAAANAVRRAGPGRRVAQGGRRRRQAGPDQFPGRRSSRSSPTSIIATSPSWPPASI